MNVAGLVYIAAFGLDQSESLGGLLSQGPVTPALAHLFTDQQGSAGCPKTTSSPERQAANGDLNSQPKEARNERSTS
jgi:hypothetical protein